MKKSNRDHALGWSAVLITILVVTYRIAADPVSLERAAIFSAPVIPFGIR